MSDNTLKVLADAGIAVERIPGEERAILESLSPEELNILASVHQKMEAASDVKGQAEATDVIGGILF